MKWINVQPRAGLQSGLISHEELLPMVPKRVAAVKFQLL